MSVVLSTIRLSFITAYFSVSYKTLYRADQALQVRSLGNRGDGGVVQGGASALQNADRAAGICGCRGQHGKKIGLGDVVGARAGGEDPARAKHLQGPQVELFVAANSGWNRGTVLGKGGRVENHGVVLLAARSLILQQIKGIGLEPLDFSLVELGVLFGNFKRWRDESTPI